MHNACEMHVNGLFRFHGRRVGSEGHVGEGGVNIGTELGGRADRVNQ